LEGPQDSLLIFKGRFVEEGGEFCKGHGFSWRDWKIGKLFLLLLLLNYFWKKKIEWGEKRCEEGERVWGTYTLHRGTKNGKWSWKISF
jgi:hypothetical protein